MTLLPLGRRQPHVLIRRGRLTDLAYVLMLQRRESEAVGFLPAAALEGVITGMGPFALPRHRLWVAEANGESVGYLYASPGAVGRAAVIVQVCLQEDARRHEYGTALVSTAEQWAASLQRPAMRCSVATDLEAGAFWAALGYHVVAIELGGQRRGRRLERRYHGLACGLLIAEEVPRCP